MPDITTNLGLKKPIGTENVTRVAYNENLEIMDSNAAKANHNHDSSYDAAGAAATVQTNLTAHLAETASLTVKSHVQLQTAVDTSETKALTPKALNNHLSDLASHGEVLSLYRSGKDSNGIFVTLEWKRANGTLAKKSVLSGGTSPKYTTRTVTYYDAAGTTVVLTKSYTETYTGDDLTSEVLA